VCPVAELVWRWQVTVCLLQNWYRGGRSLCVCCRIGMEVAGHCVSCCRIAMEVAGHCVSCCRIGMEVAGHCVSCCRIGMEVAGHCVSCCRIGMEVAGHCVSVAELHPKICLLQMKKMCKSSVRHCIDKTCTYLKSDIALQFTFRILDQVLILALVGRTNIY
jgi:hypothetical protein